MHPRKQIMVCSLPGQVGVCDALEHMGRITCLHSPVGATLVSSQPKPLNDGHELAAAVVYSPAVNFQSHRKCCFMGYQMRGGKDAGCTWSICYYSVRKWHAEATGLALFRPEPRAAGDNCKLQGEPRREDSDDCSSSGLGSHVTQQLVSAFSNAAPSYHGGQQVKSRPPGIQVQNKIGGLTFQCQMTRCRTEHHLPSPTGTHCRPFTVYYLGLRWQSRPSLCTPP